MLILFFLISTYLGHKNLYWQRHLSTYLFSRAPCHHQFSNYVPTNSLTIQPNHQPLSMISTSGIPGEMNNQINWLKFCPLEEFALKTTPEWGYSAVVVPCLPLCSISISCRTISKSTLFFLLSQLTLEHPISGRRSCSRKKNHGYVDYLHMQLTCALRTFSRSVSYISLLLYERVLLCMPNIITWQIRQHSVHDGQLTLHVTFGVW